MYEKCHHFTKTGSGQTQGKLDKEMRYLALQNADHWFHNLDKFIHYVNLNASRGGPVVAMYSTPTKYTTVKKVRGKHLFAATFMQKTMPSFYQERLGTNMGKR